jgi:hypothetical protein
MARECVQSIDKRNLLKHAENAKDSARNLTELYDKVGAGSDAAVSALKVASKVTELSDFVTEWANAVAECDIVRSIDIERLR